MMQCKSFFLKERTLKGLPGTLLVIMVLMLNVNCKCQKLFTSPINVLFSDQLTQFLCVFFSRLTITQMLQLCDFAGGSTSLAERSHVHDAYCCTNLVKEGSSEAPPPSSYLKHRSVYNAYFHFSRYSSSNKKPCRCFSGIQHSNQSFNITNKWKLNTFTKFTTP